MKFKQVFLMSLLLGVALSMVGCKKQAVATQNTPLRTTEAAPAPLEQTATAPAVPSAASAAITDQAAFDFNTVPESAAAIPPFPYIDYPPKVDAGSRETVSSPLDEIYVILGRRLHRLEGRVEQRTFDNRDAEMSALEVRRNYEAAIKALGGIKVNLVAQDDKAILAAGGDELKLRDKLHVPQDAMSYDAYLMRKGPVRHWIVLMVNDRLTRLLSIQEKPFVQSVGYVNAGGAVKLPTSSGAPPVAPQPVKLDGIPISNTALPPFPYLAYPPTLDKAFQQTKSAKFDSVSVIVGDHLQVLEGRVETRSFHNKDADMSQMALRRNYESAVAGLGGVKVSTVAPENGALIVASGDESEMRKKLRILELNMSYDAYVIRTPEKRVWVVLMFNDSKTSILTVEEKDFVQSVAFISADKMATELATKGRIALYVNFDTDKATIRADGKPTVDEIANLMKIDGALKLAIEGHTDNSGDARPNKELSQQRADAVMNSLVMTGVDKRRLSASGFGDKRPLANNKDEQGRAKNRRVELVKTN